MKLDDLRPGWASELTAIVDRAARHVQGGAEWHGLRYGGARAADCGLIRPGPRPGVTARLQREAPRDAAP